MAEDVVYLAGAAKARRAAAAAAGAAILLLAGCGGGTHSPAASSAPSAAATIVKVGHGAPAWIVHELRHTYEPFPRCPRPCPAFLRRSREHVLLLHRSTALAPGTLPRAVAEARLVDGQRVTFYLYRSQTGQLCDDVSVTSGSRPVAGGLTPGLPCVPGAPCGAICLEQIHCCGVNVLVGTVAARAQELGAAFDDGAAAARYRLDEPLVPGRAARRFFVLDLRPHGYADPVRLYVGHRTIATGSVSGLG
jgi:hypothetical protein